MTGELISISVSVLWTASALFFEYAGKKIKAMNLNLIRLIIACFLLGIILIFISGNPFPQMADKKTWFWMSLSGFVGFVFGDFFLFSSYRVMPARFTQLIMTLAPMFAAISGYFLLGERLNLTALIGIIVTLSGIAISILKRNDAVKEPKPTAATTDYNLHLNRPDITTSTEKRQNTNANHNENISSQLLTNANINENISSQLLTNENLNENISSQLLTNANLNENISSQLHTNANHNENISSQLLTNANHNENISSQLHTNANLNENISSQLPVHVHHHLSHEALTLSIPTKGVIFALLAAIGQGVGLVLSKHGMEFYEKSILAHGSQIDANSLYIPLAATQIRIITGIVCFMVIIAFMQSFRNLFSSFKEKKSIAAAFGGAIVGPVVGVSLSLLAVQHANTAIASTLMALAPIIILLPDRFIYKRRITFIEVMGAIISVCGVAILLF